MLESVGGKSGRSKGYYALDSEDWRIAEMADFLLKNKDAKETEIIEEAIRIREMEED